MFLNLLYSSITGKALLYSSLKLSITSSLICTGSNSLPITCFLPLESSTIGFSGGFGLLPFLPFVS